MLFLYTGNNQCEMGKAACKKKTFENSDNPKYYCKKCNALVKKKDKVCKPKKIKKPYKDYYPDFVSD